LTKATSSSIDKAPMARAKNSTWRGVNCPVGKGRCAVRAITASMRASSR
jgi:hypothetical protein